VRLLDMCAHLVREEKWCGGVEEGGGGEREKQGWGILGFRIRA
jgi:hypothetical protein